MLTNEPYCKVLPMDHYSKVLLFFIIISQQKQKEVDWSRMLRKIPKTLLPNESYIKYF